MPEAHFLDNTDSDAPVVRKRHRQAIERPQSCARPTCADAATVRFFFDGSNGVLVLDAKVKEYGASGVLCERHAELLRAPRGWVIDDRRVSIPRLFPVNRFEEPGRALSSMAQKARKLLEPVAQSATPLPLDGGPQYTLPAEYEAAHAGSDPVDAAQQPEVVTDSKTASRAGRPTERTPLLAKAFEAADQRVRPTSALSSLIPQQPASE